MIDGAADGGGCSRLGEGASIWGGRLVRVKV